MPIISGLKSSHTREKKSLLKEESEAQELLQRELNDDTREIGQFLLLVGKVLLNLETKLARLEATNEKLVEAYDQSSDTKAAEQFQKVLDEDLDFTEGIIDKISELKVLKEEAEKKWKEIEAHNNLSLEAQVQEKVKHLQSSSHLPEVASIWSPTNLGPMKPPQLDIRKFSGDMLRWQEFWDAFDTSMHQARYAPVDKCNYLKSKLEGEVLDAISGYQLSNDNYAVVIDILKKRFGNKQLIIDAHYRSLSHLPPASCKAI